MSARPSRQTVARSGVALAEGLDAGVAVGAGEADVVAGDGAGIDAVDGRGTDSPHAATAREHQQDRQSRRIGGGYYGSVVVVARARTSTFAWSFPRYCASRSSNSSQPVVWAKSSEW